MANCYFCKQFENTTFSFYQSSNLNIYLKESEIIEFLKEYLNLNISFNFDNSTHSCIIDLQELHCYVVNVSEVINLLDSINNSHTAIFKNWLLSIVTPYLE